MGAVLSDRPRHRLLPHHASVRGKLLSIALLPFVAVLPLLLMLASYWGVGYYDRLLTSKVASDLAVADQYFSRVVDHVGLDVANLGASYALVNAVGTGNDDALRALLVERQSALKLDFLNLMDAQGGLRVSSLQTARPDARLRRVAATAERQGSATTLEVYSADELAALAPALAERARTELVPTPNAAPVDHSMDTRGMVIHTAVPVRDGSGRLLAVLEGGVLLNRNLDFIDTLNGVVYPAGSLPAGSDGTATLFIDDVRIATNVRLFGDRRALGTRVSKEVRDSVLGAGRTWLDRAFVVHDWYVSGYRPVVDGKRQRIGMLYVGYLEAPFRHAKHTAIAVVVALCALVCVAGVLLSSRVARTIYRPIEDMGHTMSRFEGGDLDARTAPHPACDEIADLAHSLDHLLDTVRRQNRELKDWGDELDRKVVERTAELARANEALKAAQRQLALTEKLAAIGQITAGVAHEINNPVAVIQGNLDLLRDLLGERAAPVTGELALIDEQIVRIHTIVAKLLQFASPEEFSGYVQPIEVDEAIADSLLLVRHLMKDGGIAVTHVRGAQSQVRINRGELQQVLINLFTNATHAMKGKGTLMIESADWSDIDEDGQPRHGVDIVVRDDGCGIAPEHLARVFDAFFTTKHGKGTGLGLSISYTLVARYGGSIRVDSRPGAGSTFTVRLPA